MLSRSPAGGRLEVGAPVVDPAAVGSSVDPAAEGSSEDPTAVGPSVDPTAVGPSVVSTAVGSNVVAKAVGVTVDVAMVGDIVNWDGCDGSSVNVVPGSEVGIPKPESGTLVGESTVGGVGTGMLVGAYQTGRTS
jgi:hypothetical protein